MAQCQSFPREMTKTTKQSSTYLWRALKRYSKLVTEHSRMQTDDGSRGETLTQVGTSEQMDRATGATLYSVWYGKLLLGSRKAASTDYGVRSNSRSTRYPPLYRMGLCTVHTQKGGLQIGQHTITAAITKLTVQRSCLDKAGEIYLHYLLLLTESQG